MFHHGGRASKVPMPVDRARKLKVCHVAATTEAAVWVFEQLRDLRDQHGYEVAAVLNGDRGSLVDRLRAEGIAVYSSDFDFTGSADLLGFPRKILKLASIFRAQRFDVVQTHLFHSMVIGRIAAWIADVPSRLSMIAGPFHLETYSARWIDQWTCWMDTGIIPSCDYTRRLYLGMGVPEDRLTTIYYGPDERKFDPSVIAPANLRAELGFPDDTPLIGMVALFYTQLGVNRWTPRAVQRKSVKGHEDLIRAPPIVLREFPNAKFLLVGSGWEAGGRAYMKSMQKLVADLGLQDSIIFTGFRQDVPRILRDLDVSVQPSLNENLGGTIESLLMECPTVATRVGGLTDSVVDGVTGVLVNPADLARGIIRLLREPARAKALAQAGRQRMLSQFTLRRSVDDLARLYENADRYPGRERAGYRPLVSFYRLVAAGAVSAAIVTRYVVMDTKLLPRWDVGWRPWHAKPILLARFYASLAWRLLRFYASLIPRLTLRLFRKLGGTLGSK